MADTWKHQRSLIVSISEGLWLISCIVMLELHPHKLINHCARDSHDSRVDETSISSEFEFSKVKLKHKRFSHLASVVSIDPWELNRTCAPPISVVRCFSTFPAWLPTVEQHGQSHYAQWTREGLRKGVSTWYACRPLE